MEKEKIQKLLKREALYEKFEISSPLTSKDGTTGILFFFTEKVVYYFQVGFWSGKWIVQFLTHLVCVSFAFKRISANSIDLAINSSKSAFSLACL